MDDQRPLTGEVARRTAPRRARWAHGATALVMALSGCVTGDPPENDPSGSPSPSPPTLESQPPPPGPSLVQPSPTTGPAVEFAFQPAERPCPPASALDTLPLAGERSYASIDPSQFELENELAVYCTYKRSELGEDGEDTIREDHAQITSQISLFRRWSDSYWAGHYPAIPVDSTDLDDWMVTVRYSQTRNWWEDCGDTGCGDGEEPTVRTRALQTSFAAHVGNLEFESRVTYIAEVLPPDAERRNVAVFQELVLNVIADRERAE